MISSHCVAARSAAQEVKNLRVFYIHSGEFPWQQCPRCRSWSHSNTPGSCPAQSQPDLSATGTDRVECLAQEHLSVGNEGRECFLSLCSDRFMLPVRGLNLKLHTSRNSLIPAAITSDLKQHFFSEESLFPCSDSHLLTIRSRLTFGALEDKQTDHPSLSVTTQAASSLSQLNNSDNQHIYVVLVFVPTVLPCRPFGPGLPGTPASPCSPWAPCWTEKHSINYCD